MPDYEHVPKIDANKLTDEEVIQYLAELENRFPGILLSSKQCAVDSRPNIVVMGLGQAKTKEVLGYVALTLDESVNIVRLLDAAIALHGHELLDRAQKGK